MHNPADIVVRHPVERLIPYARNSRTHSDKQISQLMASIKEWGWTTPVLITEEGVIIAGHGRVIAAQRLGLKEVPCVVAGGWSEAQIRAYVIADNRLAENAGWDLELLALEIEDLRLEDFNIDLTGFDAAALEEMFDKEAGANDNGSSEGSESDGIDYQEKFAVLIECDDEQEQQAVYERLVAQGYSCKVLVN